MVPLLSSREGCCFVAAPRTLVNADSAVRGGAGLVDGKERMPELVCDGCLLSTPAGSTAYNYSAHGPILPIGSDVLALTAVAAFRPRRWRGALLPKSAVVRFEVLGVGPISSVHSIPPVCAEKPMRLRGSVGGAAA